MKNINENERAVVIKSVCECGSTKFNTTVKDKPFCFLCGKDARETVKPFKPKHMKKETARQSCKTDVMPRFLKTKYTLEELDQYVVELSARTDKHIHRGKLEDIEKLIRWRRRYDALNP
jgi:hypothetical protein